MLLRACLFGVALCAALLAGPVQAQDAETLRARHAALREQLAGNPFGRPLHLESREGSGVHAGEVYATLDKPYGTVAPALQAIEQWCGILILPANVKRCQASREEISLYVARKPQDPLEDAYRVDFRYSVAAASVDYMRVELGAASGPFGTTNYRISVELAPLDERRAFLHMAYSYTLGVMARLAMQGYFATAGRDKVGFSIVEQLPDGRPVYVDGVRGALERTTMRYYLAIEAHLGSLDTPPSERLEARLRAWYAGIERHPRQLREELRRDEYLRLKRAEAALQQGDAASGATR